MRIISGRARGLKLAEVGAGDPAAHLRPTSDRLREAIFNLIVNGAAASTAGNPLNGARVLDLFAGTGALGLEALSRGAAHVTLVDSGSAALALIRANVDKMRAGAEVAVLRRDATALGPNLGAPSDVVFLDPPYGKSLGEKALSSALQGGWIAPGALIIWEEATAMPPPPGCTLLDQRRYGESWVTFLRAPDKPGNGG